MIRRTQPYQPGTRYLLQYPGSVERLAVASAAAEGAALEPLPFQAPLPPSPLPGGEWVLEPEERLLRDGAGQYWSVNAARTDGGAPYATEVTFSRHLPSGDRIAYRGRSPHRPDALGDAQLLELLRLAWRGLATDADERRRRTLRPVAAEL